MKLTKTQRETLRLAKITAMSLSKQLHSNPFNQQHTAKQADRLVELLRSLDLNK